MYSVQARKKINRVITTKKRPHSIKFSLHQQYCCTAYDNEPFMSVRAPPEVSFIERGDE